MVADVRMFVHRVLASRGTVLTCTDPRVIQQSFHFVAVPLRTLSWKTFHRLKRSRGTQAAKRRLRTLNKRRTTFCVIFNWITFPIRCGQAPFYFYFFYFSKKGK